MQACIHREFFFLPSRWIEHRRFDRYNPSTDNGNNYLIAVIYEFQRVELSWDMCLVIAVVMGEPVVGLCVFGFICTYIDDPDSRVMCCRSARAETG